MARYYQYTDIVVPGVRRLIETDFTVFLMKDCDDTVMGDLEVVEWAATQGAPIHVDNHFWNHPVRLGKDHNHAAIVDAFDSAVLMIRDPDLAMAFKLKFC
jgi:hypothetical protein